MAAQNQIDNDTGNRQKYWVLLAVGVGTFMTALDGSVVNVVLPVIKQYFNSDIATIEWTVVVYLLVVSGLLLTFGRLGDLRGHKTIFLLGFAVFITSSALCGLSPSPWALIAFRGLQAFGAAMLMANSPAILTKNFPPAQRGQALGLQATMTYLGLVTGPAFGGWLTDQFSWRAVFYINIPVGLTAFLLCMVFIPKDSSSAGRQEKFDLPGAAVFSAGLVALLLGLNQGHAWGWNSPLILGLLAAAFLLLGLFIYIELHVAHPMLDLSLFKHRNFSAATTSALMNYIVIYSVIFVLPFYLIQGRSFSPSQAGLLLTAQPIIMMVTAPISGTLSDRFSTRTPSIIGLSLMAVGMILLARLGPDTPTYYVALSLGVVGLGTGTFISPNTSALMGSAPRNRQGIAAGVMATARNTGMVLGVGISGAILTTIMDEAIPGTFFRAIQVGFLAAMVAALIGAAAAVIRKNEKDGVR